jgi:hypothetical protein
MIYTIRNMHITKILAAIFLASTAVLVATFYPATPGPAWQTVHGVGVGDYFDSKGVTYFSGRRLSCSLWSAASNEIFCTIEIEGKSLELRVIGQPFEQSCSANYDGKAWSCRMGFRHSHVGQFAFISESLTLTADQMNALRARFWVENLPTFYSMYITIGFPFAAVILLTPFIAVRLFCAYKSKLFATALTFAIACGIFIFAFVFSFSVFGEFWD